MITIRVYNEDWYYEELALEARRQARKYGAVDTEIIEDLLIKNKSSYKK